MDLVDEQNRSLLGVGQVGHQVLGGLDGRTAGQLHAHAQFAGDAQRKGGFPQAGRSVKQDVTQRLAALAGGIDDDHQPLVDLALADHVGHALRPQVAVFVFLA